MRLKIFVLLAFLITTSVIASQPVTETVEQKLEKASGLYSEGKYSEALDMWLSLYNSGYRSAPLNYNIGNAYFKLNNVPASILFYERALLLRPADEDINYNLQIARTMVTDKFAEIPEVFFVSWFRFISLNLSSNSWAVISLTSFIMCLVLFSMYLFTARYRLKVGGFWFAILLLVISISAISFAAKNRKLVYDNRNAIIFCPAVNGKSSPDQSGTDLFVIHEGSKVTVEDTVGEWHEIRLSDGNKGWVPSNCLTRL